MKREWIKLYTEVLHDPKMRRLDPLHFQTTILLFLMAAELDKDGLLPPEDDMAWELRLDAAQLKSILQHLESVGIATQTDMGWMVTNWQKRQYSESYERVKRYRTARSNAVVTQAKQEGSGGVADLSTSPLISSDSLSDSQEGGGVGEGAPPVTPAPRTGANNSMNTAQAIATWGDNSLRDAEQLYCRITGQITFPPSWSDEHRGALVAVLLDHFRGDLEKAAASGAPVFARWCSTRSKSGGRFYSRTGAGWLDWWLADLAPEPEAADDKPAPVFDLPKPTLTCGTGQKIYDRCKQTFGSRAYDSNVADFQTHIGSCHLCGGSSNIVDVSQAIKALASAKRVTA